MVSGLGPNEWGPNDYEWSPGDTKGLIITIVICVLIICFFAIFIFFVLNKEEPPLPPPLQLTEEESEYWKLLMLESSPGPAHTENAARNADKIILELRKRTGGEK
jgi:hypothetical protein